MASKKRRSVTGILLLDKPAGLSSNKVLQRVKWLYQARKAGHTGSLDPLATGLLPLCFGDATKVSGFLLDADKRYVVRARAGMTTNTADAEGEILRTREVGDLTAERIEAELADFRGAIQQVPPMYSALKHQGQRLYKLAREGKEVERAPRDVTIHELRLLGVEREHFELEVHCSKGTYVRSLVEDLGEALGCGAHVEALRRTALGPFARPAMVSLAQVEAAAEQGEEALDALLIPMEQALVQWPEVRLSNEVAHYLLQGQPVWVPQAPAGGWVRLFAEGERFLGMGHMLSDGRVAPKRLLAQA
ncbi:tRNA pseudouridine(55) synthase TruB [Alkalilimnicola sp. S0819]|uniref:tRNA pseudouridine(55) synthase TruB n=1 Tax=Alkalilimnicola sp. S0819 TaxID=2613922 RepID=UPI0012615E4E|nr:tRNA pseudouridine(55) synthase TruB [Alkalilimnicola sp. S0819]KAB7628443.1 tRNA pseudouridine(55) synthase TruB [Alkalilimnicola sp. S0819]MPQ15347.1 tRNA pseudouridine(55) synthase TruB [Alkalilimnicola sp. S0819]